MPLARKKPARAAKKLMMKKSLAPAVKAAAKAASKAVSRVAKKAKRPAKPALTKAAVRKAGALVNSAKAAPKKRGYATPATMKKRLRSGSFVNQTSGVRRQASKARRK